MPLFGKAFWRSLSMSVVFRDDRWRLAIAPGVALCALLPAHLYPDAPQAIIYPLFLAGMVFPGLAHGALDHCLQGPGPLAGRPLGIFIAGYVALSTSVVILWWVAPLCGLILFLVTSAWHFGESDTRGWGAYHPVIAFLQGIAMLGALLTTHPIELRGYLLQMGGISLDGIPSGTWPAAAVLSFALLMIIATRFCGGAARTRALTGMIVPIVGIFLPLLWAFGIYFILQHSLQGWLYIREKGGLSGREMIRQSLPFTGGALALMALLLAMVQFTEIKIWGLIPGLFVFLAAISLPHIFFIHRFYGAKEKAK